jgi:alcohol dehydrogenase class IV
LIGQALQINTNINHGKSVSLMLPYVMEFNLITNYPKYARLAEIMGENVQGLPTEKAAMKSIDAVKKLSQDIGIPQRLRDIGVEKDQIPGFVDTLFTYYGNRLNSNPRPVSREEVTGIYEAAF